MMAAAAINTDNATQAPDPETFWISPLEPIPAQTIELPASDQVGVTVIQPLVLCFTTTHELNVPWFVDAVKLAAAGVVWETPALAGSVVFEDETCKRITCRIPKDPRIQVRVKYLPHMDANELDAGHWAPHRLTHADLCLAPRPTFGIGTYNFGVQANIIKGGVIFVLHMNHTILDGSSHAILVSIFGHHLSRALDGKAPTRSGLMPPQAIDKSTAYGTHPARPLLDWQDWRRAPTNTMSQEAASAALLQRIQKLTLTVWHVSPEQQTKLRSRVQDPKKEKLSYSTCFSTWMWKAITRARGLAADTPTKFLTPVQTRGRVKEIHPTYSGSALVYGRSKATVSELRSLSNHELGQRISRSVAWWNPERIREYWGSIEDHVKKESIATVQPNTDRDFGTDVEVTNQMNFPFYKVHFGRGLEVRSWRLPGIPFTDGWVTILPRMADGGFEIQLYMARDTLGKLIQDPDFREYCTYWCASDPKIDHQVAETPVGRARL